MLYYIRRFYQLIRSKSFVKINFRIPHKISFSIYKSLHDITNLNFISEIHIVSWTGKFCAKFALEITPKLSSAFSSQIIFSLFITIKKIVSLWINHQITKQPPDFFIAVSLDYSCHFRVRKYNRNRFGNYKYETGFKNIQHAFQTALKTNTAKTSRLDIAIDFALLTYSARILEQGVRVALRAKLIGIRGKFEAVAWQRHIRISTSLLETNAKRIDAFDFRHGRVLMRENARNAR